RAVLFLEEMLQSGGYFQSVEQGFFVDSGLYPERNGDGIARKIDGGVSPGEIYERDEDYMAPVTAHFGYNNLAQYGLEDNGDGNENPGKGSEKGPASLIGGSTFENPDKIVFIDELDEEDNVHRRLEKTANLRNSSKIKPEMEWQGDGIVLLTLFLPTDKRTAEFSGLEIGRRMGLEDVEVIHSEIMQPAEGTRIELKGRFNQVIDTAKLEIPPAPEILSEEEIRAEIKSTPLKVVAGTVGNDEHSVGLREVIDIKHGGLEGFGIQCHYLGTSVPLEKLVDAAIELEADAILASTIISHYDVHYQHMKRLHELCVEKGIRDRIILISGGTQVSPEMAVEQGVDAGFGRGTKGIHVATFLVKRRREIRGE
ncbi:MAG: cobalamin-dependent protein, partial [Spirochaetaceae bacterium]|nr:cobalamin-dependent protein [Spirochaetaceae bacterium]MCF7950244.1 cobalamin-dependent protein [Spirochaetaceae bacterium]